MHVTSNPLYCHRTPLLISFRLWCFLLASCDSFQTSRRALINFNPNEDTIFLDMWQVPEKQVSADMFYISDRHEQGIFQRQMWQANPQRGVVLAPMIPQSLTVELFENVGRYNLFTSLDVCIACFSLPHSSLMNTFIDFKSNGVARSDLLSFW